MTITATITLDQVDVERLVTDVRRLAIEQPHRRAACFYRAADDQPLCIVGCALHSQGVDLSTFTPRQNARHIGELLQDNGHPVTKYVLWLSSVQSSQDRGSTWSKAVDSADRWSPII